MASIVAIELLKITKDTFYEKYMLRLLLIRASYLRLPINDCNVLIPYRR